MAKSANVTKHDAGGAGDYAISDGYVRTVEKVWIDTYTFTAAIPSGTSIDIAKISANKKITGIDVIFPALSTGASGTGTTISLGYRANSVSTTGGSTFLSAGEACAGVTSLKANIGLLTVMAAASTIYLGIGRIATTTTGGTITTIVRYT
jgi:hypothetical protein